MKMRACVAVFVFLMCCGVLRGGEAVPSKAFKLDLEGMVTIGTDAAGGGAVYLAPQRGLSVRIANASPAEWQARNGRWAEVEALVTWNGSEAAAEIWEFSLEDHPPRPGKDPVECEGMLGRGDGSGRILQTRGGDVRLLGGHALLQNESAVGRKVDISGELAVDKGELVVNVWNMEID